MTTIYSSVSISGYNASPPADDGSAVSTNQITWAKHKEKLGDPLKTLAETINTNVASGFGKILHNATTQLTTTTTIADADRGKTFATTNALTVNLPAAATVGSNYVVTIINTDGSTVTVDGNGSETINGSATSTLTVQYSGGFYFCDGTEWYELRFGDVPDGSIATAKIADDAVTADKLADTAVTADSYTNADITVDAQGRITAASNGTSFTITRASNESLSGTEIDFGSIPSGVTRIKGFGTDVSFDADGGNLIVQLTDSGGVETTGYTGQHSQDEGTGTSISTGFIISNTAAAADTNTFMFDIVRVGSGNKWVFSCQHARTNSTQTGESIGHKTLSAELTGLRFTSSNGTPDFDGGELYIEYS